MSREDKVTDDYVSKRDGNVRMFGKHVIAADM